MNTKTLRALCLSLPGVTETTKLESDLSYTVNGQMFCLTANDDEGGVSFKVPESEFKAMTEREGIIPAPYMARYQWVFVLDFAWLTDAEWEHYIRQAYELVKNN